MKKYFNQILLIIKLNISVHLLKFKLNGNVIKWKYMTHGVPIYIILTGEELV